MPRPEDTNLPYYWTADEAVAAAILTNQRCDILKVDWANEEEKIVQWCLFARTCGNFTEKDFRDWWEEIESGQSLVEPKCMMRKVGKLRKARYEFSPSPIPQARIDQLTKRARSTEVTPDGKSSSQ